MNLKQTACVALALVTASANFAFAQGRGDRGRDRDDRRAERRDADRRDNRHDRRDFDRHDNGRRGPPSWSNNRYDVPRAYQRWNRGDRLPAYYRDRQYVVNDWRTHRLSAPPRGYQWVQVGSDYLLVAVATGIIAQLLMQ